MPLLEGSIRDKAVSVSSGFGSVESSSFESWSKTSTYPLFAIHGVGTIVIAYVYVQVVIGTVNHEYFVVRIFSDSLAYAKIKCTKIHAQY